MNSYLKQNASRLLFVVALAAFGYFGVIDAASAACGGMVLATMPFPVNPELTGIAIGYKNPDVALIADQVMPRTPALGTKKFKYLVYDVAQGFTVPDTKVGRKSEPNIMEFGGTEVTAETQDYGLDDIIPNDDINADNQGVDPRGLSVQSLTGLVNLDREVRVAGTVFALGTYPAANKVTLAGASQWSDFVNSDPVAAISAALDGLLIRPNIGVFGRATFSKLAQHPKIVQAIFKTNQGAGIVTRAQLADLFELQEILVGEAWVNTAKKGQAAAMSRAWGKHAAFLFRNREAIQSKTPNNENGVTFGFTAQFGSKVAGSIAEPKIGLRGSERVRVGESVKEVVSAPDVGYFFQNAVA
jgi:hypothetical protein